MIDISTRTVMKKSLKTHKFVYFICRLFSGVFHSNNCFDTVVKNENKPMVLFAGICSTIIDGRNVWLDNRYFLLHQRCIQPKRSSFQVDLEFCSTTSIENIQNFFLLSSILPE